MTEAQDIRFSVVIPTYNAEKTIARAIESVLAQTLPAHEIIVVDDASTDATVEMLQTKFSDSIKLVQKITNTGGSIARNSGMDIATGDYIAFLDADDVWHKDKLAVINAILSQNCNIRLLYHPYTQDPLDKPLPENITLYKLPFVKLLPANLIATSCAIIGNNPFFRFDPHMRYTEDFDLWLRIGFKHKIFFITVPLTQIFRPFTSTGGVSENKWQMRKGEIRAYRKLIKLNPLFILLFPLLLTNSIVKHVYKKVKTPNP